MGSEFSIVFDIIVVAVIGGMAFVGWKKGFATVIINLATTVVAFALGLGLSAPIAKSVYENVIAEPLEEQISAAMAKQLDAVGLDALRLGSLNSIDFDRIAISGTPITEYSVDYKGGTIAVVDLSKLDMSKTGISDEDLTALGLGSDTDLTKFNAQTAEFSKTDIDKYGLEKLVTAQFAAVSLAQTEMFENFNEIANVVSKLIPSFSTKGSAENVTISGVRTAVLLMMKSDKSITDAIMEDVIAPNCTVFIRTILFIVIFILVQIVLGIAANALKIVNKIPVIGKANSALGLLAGLCEGAIAVLIICMVTKFLVVISHDSAIMLNSSAINETFLFKHIFEIDFINFNT